MSSRASATVFVAVWAFVVFAALASAQWVAGCGQQLEIAVDNQTPYPYAIRANGVPVQTVQPGGHLHMLYPHRSFHLEALPVGGGP